MIAKQINQLIFELDEDKEVLEKFLSLDESKQFQLIIDSPDVKVYQHIFTGKGVKKGNMYD